MLTGKHVLLVEGDPVSQYAATADGLDGDRIILAAHSMRLFSMHMGVLRLAYFAEIMKAMAKKAVKEHDREPFLALTDQMKLVLSETQKALQLLYEEERAA